MPLFDLQGGVDPGGFGEGFRDGIALLIKFNYLRHLSLPKGLRFNHH